MSEENKLVALEQLGKEVGEACEAVLKATAKESAKGKRVSFTEGVAIAGALGTMCFTGFMSRKALAAALEDGLDGEELDAVKKGFAGAYNGKNEEDVERKFNGACLIIQGVSVICD